ncbi:MAG: SRPBCC domain-containing protein [Patescibacteria group bacterium]
MQKIKIETTVHASPEKVWEYWNGAEHIPHWAFASDDWGATSKTNDLKEGGRFLTYMAPRDGSPGFDFSGVYTKVIAPTKLDYTIDDGRTVTVDFEQVGDSVKIVQEFEMENENTEELQRSGWQGFLDNFKKYVEGN